jgi:uncharacterized membrane protein YgcG
VLGGGGPHANSRFYVAHEVLDHAKALATIQELLIPSAKSTAAQLALSSALGVVQSHFLLALDVERSLASACGSNAEPSTGGCDQDGGASSGSSGGGSAGGGGSSSSSGK